MEYPPTQKKMSLLFDSYLGELLTPRGFDKKKRYGDTCFIRDTPDGFQRVTPFATRGRGYDVGIVVTLNIKSAVEIVHTFYPHLNSAGMSSLLLQLTRFASKEEIMMGFDSGPVNKGRYVCVHDTKSLLTAMEFFTVVIVDRVLPFFDEYSTCCQADIASNELFLDDLRSPENEIGGIALAKVCGKSDWRTVASKRIARLQEELGHAIDSPVVQEIRRFVEHLSAL